MRLGALFACLLVGIAAGNPLRITDAHGNSGYDYGVQHPAGRSRVHVRTGGGNQNGNYYPVKHNTQHISDKSYVNLNSDSTRHHPYRQHPKYESSSNVPVYVEHSYSSPPVSYQPSSNSYPIYDQSQRANYPQRHVIPQEYLGREPFYGPVIDEIPAAVQHSGYSGPHIQQIADDSSPNYEPIEQLTLKENPSFIPVSVKIPADEVILISPESHIVQQTSDDLPLNFEVNGDKYPESPVLSQSPVDNDPSPVIPDYIKPLADEQVHIDQKSIDFPTKTVQEDIPDTEIVPIFTEPHSSQQEFIDVSPPNPTLISAVKYDTDDKISQEALDKKLSFGLNDNFHLKQSNVPDIVQSSEEYKTIPVSAKYPQNPIPISQIAVDHHPSQAVYDSPVDPLFSDDHSLKQSFHDQPKYRFQPIGEPYEKISHSTAIIHPSPPNGPHGPYPIGPEIFSVQTPLTEISPVSQSVLTEIPASHSVKLPPDSQEHLVIDAPLVKDPPLSQSVKLPQNTQQLLEVDAQLTQNVPSYPSVKLPPQPQEHIHVDGPFTKNPSPYPSVKLPPPPQENIHVDGPFVKSPSPYPSVKLPPPPQEHLHVDGPFTKNSPSYPSVKLPPPPQEHLHVDGPFTKNPPSYPSIKLPPPSQEHLDVNGPFTKNPLSHPSVKLPPPTQEHLLIDGPFTKNPSPYPSVKLPPPPQEHLHVDGPLTKNPPFYPPVKLPPPPQKNLHIDEPFTKNRSPYPSVKLPPPPQEHLHVDGPFTKNLSPYPSVKLPPPLQENLHIDGPFTKNLSPYPSVKLPPPPQEHLAVNGPFTKNPSPYPSVKLPPPPQEHLHVDGPFSKNPSPYPSVKLPPAPQEHLDVNGPFTKNLSPYPSVKLPPPPQEHLDGNGPFTKNPPSYPSVKLPPPPQEHLHVDGPFTKNLSPYPSVKLPPPPQEHLVVNGPFTKNPSVKLPPPLQENLPIDGPFTKNLSPYPSVKLPPQEHLHIDVPSTKSAPSYHSVKLPPPQQEHLIVDGPASHIKGGPSNSIKTGLPGVKAPPVESQSEHLYPIGVQAPPAAISIKNPSASLFPQSNILQENSHLKHPQQLEDSLSKHPPISHTVRLPSIEPKSLSPNQIDNSGNIDDQLSLKQHTPVSHSIRLPIPDPASKVTSVPNLFAAVPSLSDEEALLNKDISSDSPVAEALVSGPIHPSEDLQELSHHRPISHSVRLPISSSRTSRNPNDAPRLSSSHLADNHRKQDFPAFPVESAFNQKDPVSDHVSGLTPGYRNGAGHDDTNHEPDEEESSDTPPSVNDARAEVDRINKEIGASFGDRLFANSRF